MDSKEYRNMGIVAILLVVTFAIIYGPSIQQKDIEGAGSGSGDAQPEEQSRVESEANNVQVVVGTFVIGHEVRAFQECNTPDAEALWMRDETDLVKQLYEESARGTDPYEQVFGSVRLRREDAPEDGFAADYPGMAVVTSINYWPMEGFDCNYAWDSFDFMAFGNEPFWRLTLDENSATLFRPEAEVIFGVNGNEWPVKSPDGRFEMSAAAEECRDSMSGTYFGRKVTVKMGDSVLSGCGMFGTR